MLWTPTSTTAPATDLGDLLHKSPFRAHAFELLRQRREPELQVGPIGKVMDAVMVQEQWRDGITGVFDGPKVYVETGRGPSEKA
jgi:hypothetical protein